MKKDKAPDQAQEAKSEQPTQTAKRKNDYKFFVMLRAKPQSFGAGAVASAPMLRGFETKTEINDFLSSNPELELAEARVIRGYEKNLKAQTRISF